MIDTERVRREMFFEMGKSWDRILKSTSPAWTSYQILVVGFAALILIGSILLSLPIASAEGKTLSLIDAIFMSASAVCVTGIAVVEPGTDLSLFGQIVLIMLVQVGGLGIVTATTLIALMLGKRIQLKERLTLQRALSYGSSSGIIRLVLYLLKVTLIIEFVGGFLLSLFFYPDFGMKAFYYGYWHAISAFCNAGFDVFGKGDSMAPYVNNLGVNLILAILTVLGTIGFFVIGDFLRKKSWSQLEAQSKLILTTTFCLIVFGTIGLFLLENTNENTMGTLSLADKILASFTQVAIGRTAGYSSVDLGYFHISSLLLMIFLMFIGTAPGSMGGGIKINTFGIILLAVYSLIKGERDVNVFSRRVPSEVVYRSFLLFFIYTFLVFFITFLLSVFEPFSFLSLLFETVAAFTTTGLSLGASKEMSVLGKSLLIFVMFVGRVGMLTFVMAITRRKKRGFYRYPEGKFSIE